jgi:hypothetical protein
MTIIYRLPLEVVERIIDDIADNHSSIKACALVCHSFLPLCRKHIFASVTLNARREDSESEERLGLPTSPASDELNHLLSNSPHLAVYIRKLDYHVRGDEFYKRRCLWLLPMFKKLVRLQKLGIKCSPRSERLDWMSSPERMVLLPLLHLPALTRICLARIRSFRLADLAGCVNLKELEIQSLQCTYGLGKFLEALPATPVMLERFKLVISKGNVKLVQQLCDARRPDGKPIINFSSLKIITVQVARLHSMKELFGMCRKLRKIDLGMFFSRLISSSI